MQVMAFAQAPKVTVKWGTKGEMTTFKPTLDLAVFIGDNSITLAKRKPSDYEIETYGPDLKLLKQTKLNEISGGDDDKQFYLANFELGGQLFQLYSVNNYKQDKSVPIEVAALDAKTLKYSNIKELVKQYPMYAIYWKGVRARIAVSEDKSKVVFLFDENKEGGYLLNVFDKDFNALASHKWSPPSGRSTSINTSVIENMLVDSNGNIFWQVEVPVGKEQRKAGKESVIGVASLPISGKINYAEIESGSNNICNLAMRLNKEGKLVVAGFYSVAGSRENVSHKAGAYTGISAKGTYMAVFDPTTGKIDRLQFNPFAEAFRTKFSIHGKTELPEVFLHDIELTDAGEVIVMGEQLIGASSIPASMMGGDNRDIIVVKLDEKGKMLFEVNIPKLQAAAMIGGHEIKKSAPGMSTFVNGYYSFVHAVKGNKLRLIYNDNLKNIAIDDPNEILRCKNIYNTSTILAEFDLTTGKYNRYVLFNGADELVVMYPLFARAMSFDRFVFFAGNNNGGETKQYKFGELTFN